MGKQIQFDYYYGIEAEGTLGETATAYSERTSEI